MPKTVIIPTPGGEGHHPLVVIAGPYRARDQVEGTYGVKLAVEINAPHDLKLDIIDYGVPTARELEDTLIAIVEAIQSGFVPYIGCMGGIGRTGMVLAALVRVFDVADQRNYETNGVIGYVRRVYHHHAVERPEQAALIKTFDVARVRTATGITRPQSESWIDRVRRWIGG